MFFSTGVDRKNVLSLARKYFIYHDYQCTPALWEGFNECEKWQHRRRIVRVWYKTRPRTVRNVIGAWAGEVQKYSFMEGENLLTENLREMLTTKIPIMIMAWNIF